MSLDERNAVHFLWVPGRKEIADQLAECVHELHMRGRNLLEDLRINRRIILKWEIGCDGVGWTDVAHSGTW
jgi:hypothetical protein